MADVEIVEVGPRDGLQAIPTPVPTEVKLELIRGLIGAGVRRLEIGSFVSPKHVPQMADMTELAGRLGRAPEGVRYIALVPNLKGAELAVAAGLREIAYVVSCTESHNQSNVRRPIADSVAEFREIAALAPVLRVGLSCSFDCPFEGRTPESAVLGLAERLLAARADIELELADTTGMATPDHVLALSRAVLDRFPGTWAFHGHDTAGFGVANVLAAHASGIRIFDASIAGLGGCPFAPGATGNVATEDVVYAFERQGIATGIDLRRLLEVAERAAALPEATTGGHVRLMPRQRVLASLEGRAAA
jgi:hydroxymethylglutaryl-CoA lyase